MKKSVNLKILFSPSTAIFIALVFFLVSIFFVPAGRNTNNNFNLMLVEPAFAQESTTFPADEAGISAYLNAGQSIDLAKAKNSLRGIEAEANNYVIGIIELPGLSEEEYPHIYISNEGWIMAYYSKFAPTSRIFQWYGYEGGQITTTTLRDAISKLCPTIGVNFSQIKANMKYYHFNFPLATKVVIAIDREDDGDEDTFNFSIPSDLIVYEGSWSFYTTGVPAFLYIDDKELGYISWQFDTLLYGNIESQYLVPGNSRIMKIWVGNTSTNEWAGGVVVFIY